MKVSQMLIKTENLNFKLGERSVLKQVHFYIDAGEIVTIMGPNGGGKTTFIKLLLGLLAPTSGTIYRKENLSIGYVPQKLALDQTMPLKVSDFLNLRQKISEKQKQEALERVGAPHIGLFNLASLSGGELQRAALARALLRKPELLVLDEPAQGLDYKGQAQFYNLIGDIRDELSCGILMISHDLHIVMGKSDRVLCLNGHICCSGVPEAVAEHPEYQKLFGREAASAYGVYTHSHNHAHDLSGDQCCDSEHIDCASSDCDQDHQIKAEA